jgi:ABC-type Zn uptake system ZnuABC Zn-binding protein ZnuA
VEPWLDDLLAASQNETVEKIHVAGPWNTPQLAKEKIERVRDALSRVCPEQRDTYMRNADRAVEAIDTVADTIKKDAEPLEVETITVLCMDWQRSFVEWIGFDIAASYAPPETLSVKDVNDLLGIGKEKDVALVCDNLQSGTEIGSEIAAEIHAHHVVLTNFPDAVPETETITKMIQYNARQLLDAAHKYREEQERISDLESQLEEETWKRKLFEAIAGVLLAVCVVEAAVLYVRRK